MRYIVDYENKIKEILKDKNYKYYIETFGCALNENDSMKYRGILEKCGLSGTKNINEANIILFNTCAIRENAEDKLFGRVGTLKNRSSKDKVICVVGCMTEQTSAIEKIKKSYKQIDIALGTRSMQLFSKRLYEFISKKAKTIGDSTSKYEIIENVPIAYEDKVRASVAIIYGCNNFCSYCIVPYVRGRERSRALEDIVSDIKELAEKGYKEITLLGQNVNSYGNDFKDIKVSFVDLLKEIEKIEGIEIIKFVSPHPKDFSDELIEFMSRSSKISKQIHLPLQSGSTKILERMNRRYTKKKYLELVEKIKEKVPEVTFSTDIIVGFPGETEEDFEETLDVVKKVKYDMIYMFCYSIRKGTVAEKMDGQIEEKEKVRRLERLKSEYEKILNEQNDKRVGTTEKILVEGVSKNNSNKYTGRTKDNKVLIFDASEEDIGKIIEVKIVENNKWFLTAIKK